MKAFNEHTPDSHCVIRRRKLALLAAAAAGALVIGHGEALAACATGPNVVNTDTGPVSNSGAADCINVENSDVSGDVTNTPTGVLTAPGQAISIIDNDPVLTTIISGNVQNQGTATGVEGIFVGGATVQGAVSNSGTLSGGFYGIRLANGASAGSISNSNSLSGGATGIILDGSTVIGAITNQAPATITSNGTGINLTNGSSAGSIANAGTIDVGGEGILVVGSTVAGAITNEADATITAGFNGIRLVTGSSAGSIANAGTLDVNGEAIVVQSSAVTGAISNTGAIDAGAYGIHLSGGASAASITNANTLAGGVEGILIEGSTVAGAVTNETNATLTGGINGIRLAAGSSATGIINAGTLNVGGEGILVQASTVTGAVDNSGTISSTGHGMRAIEGATVGSLSNGGTITVAGVGMGVYSGATVQNGITNAEGASVSGFIGAHVTGAGSVVNGGIVNAGTLNGASGAVSIDSGGSLNGGIHNTGFMTTGAGSWAISIGNATVTGGINNDGGTIGGGQRAVSIVDSNFSGGVANSGNMSSSVSRTVHVSGGTFSGGITNSGTITSASNYGIGIDFLTTFSGDINNSGTVQGASAIAIENVGTVAGQILNSNTMTGAVFGLSLLNVDTVTGGIVNEASGRITGDVTAISISGAPGTALTLTNDGLIQGTTEAINSTKGLIINQQAGSIVGNVVLSNGTTTVDQLNLSAGTMTGTTSFGAGADGMLWTGGTIFATDFGADDDSAILRGLTQATVGTTVMNGGLGTDALTFDATTAVGAAQYQNWETAQLINGSELTLNGNFVLGDTGTGTGDFTIDSSSALLAGGGNFGVVPFTQGQHGTFSNAGLVDLTNGGTGAGDTFTVGGNYLGSNGVLHLQTVLGGDGSDTDLLQIDGDSTGNTSVMVTNLGGLGAQTQEGIKIVNVDGTDSSGSFHLLGDYVFQGDQAVIGGAYAYRLYQNGVSTPDDGDWYLRSALTTPGNPPGPLYAPSAPLYEAYEGVLQTFNELGTLQQRVGNRSWGEGATPEGADVPGQGPVDGKAIWARIEAAHAKLDPKTSTTGTDYDVTTWRLQAGVDGQLHENEAGVLIGGITAHYGTASADISSIYGVGSIAATGYGVGGTLTWYGNSGFYVDTQAQATWYDSDIRSATLGTTLADGNNGFGYALSIESGQKIALSSKWSLTPQAQLAYSDVRFDTFTDKFGTRVSPGSGDSLVGRLGLSADYEDQWADAAGQVSRTHLYGIANLYNDFLDGTDVDVSGVKLVSQNQALWGGVGIGGTYSWADDKYSLYGEALAKTGLENFGNSHVLYGTVGFRMSW
ncbi:autotransporter outer membrane beta-barrel domain-containing protein [Mesorhizobium sp. CO1-1-4]|uniref:autotransporter outer membrane beta-barrel domain-containing protein n=1 Tax=Mesorhizobium sp. CO1-1-4 TaxID=2876633 RepID=UPI001CCC93A8|nr:autotransporter outer membrane beta-barrel domain-containing protein [Mesorhizobium sp. CO1-1-4]MBZ9738667.1 autotransporter outer membrane beta-barrel domain-containing protein [Mesorhizobium sp. CO1-1-4]